MSREVHHEIPDEDIIEHEESMDCICGPTVREVRPFLQLSASVVMVEHYSLLEWLEHQDEPED